MGRLSLRRQLQRRGWYADTKSWLLDGYMRLLTHAGGFPLPRRRAEFTLRFVGGLGGCAPLRVVLRANTSDLFIATEILVGFAAAPTVSGLRASRHFAAAEPFGGGAYRPVAEMVPRSAREILDLGGNIGLSVRLWQEYFPDAGITVVEPDDGNLAQLRKNVALGPAPEKVTVVRGFAAAEAGCAAVDRSSGEACMYRMACGGAAGAELVEKRAMADLVGAAAGRDGRIDLLKVDVEGAEAEIFRDCRGWIHRVSAMVVDLHDSYTPAALLADLDRAGAGYSHSVRGGGPWLVFVKFRGPLVAPEAG